jgi:DHA1 family multidrug resistance protein-like MFS transporter
MPAVSALIAIRVERNQQGGVYGINSSLNAVGNALGPAIGSAMATSFGLASVFVASAITMGLTGLAMAGGVRHFRKKGHQEVVPTVDTPGDPR